MAAGSSWAASGCAGADAMAELDDIIHQPLRLKIMAALNALPGRCPGARILPAEKADRGDRRQSRRPYRDAGEGRLCRGRQGLCRQEAADHGHRHRRRARRLRPPCRDAAGDHRGLGAAAVTYPLAARGGLVRPTPYKTAHLALSHAYSPARFRRPRTRAGVEDRGLASGDEALVRARQCRHRPRSRMRRRSTSPTMKR